MGHLNHIKKASVRFMSNHTHLITYVTGVAAIAVSVHLIFSKDQKLT